MTRLTLSLLSVILAFGLVVVACDKDEDPTVCEQYTELAQEALQEACDGEDCWSCDCALQGLEMVTSVDGTNVLFSCGDALQPSCDATSAEGCVEHPDTCKVVLLDDVETACASSPK
jgi:hypothetical protein